MIRAIMGDPDSFSGVLPGDAFTAPFYVEAPHPYDCPNMKPGETCQQTFQVYAVGEIGESAQVDGVFAGNFSTDSTALFNTAITTAASECDEANIDAFGLVEYADFAVLQHQWQNSTPPLNADINNDQAINILDLHLLSLYWLIDCNL